MNKWLNNKGETIMETVIAMGILAVGITLASTIIAMSLRNINASKNRVIAVNLAREGLEAMRNIRDTNWLRFNSKKRECWNHDPKTDTCINTDEPILPGEYIIYKQQTAAGWKWRLENIQDNPSPVPPEPPGINETYYNTGSDENLKNKAFIWNGEAWVDLTNLSIVDIDPLVDTDGDFNYLNDPDTYNHALISDPDPTVKPLGGDLARRTVFRRFLAISYLKNDGTEVTLPGDMNVDINRMRIRAVVGWQEGKFQFKTDLITHLTDYMGREKLEF